MGNARQPARNCRSILWAVTFITLSVAFSARISGESVAESVKPSNGLITFADVDPTRGRSTCRGEKIMFLNHMKADLIKIIAIYNLEVGKPLLLKEKHIESLCKPKEELKYVYRSQ